MDNNVIEFRQKPKPKTPFKLPAWARKLAIVAVACAAVAVVYAYDRLTGSA